MIFNLSGGPGRQTPVLEETCPQDVTLSEVGQSAAFQAVISIPGKPNVYAYQWYYDGQPVSGATGDTYTRAAEPGSHSIFCRVTNSAGTVQTRTATLTATTQYLYRAGNLCTAVTGGWKGTGCAMDDIYTTKAAPKITKNATNMVIEPNAGYQTSSGICHTVNKVDLSPFTRLYYDGSFTSTGANKSHAFLGIWSSIGSKQSQNRVAYIQSLSDKVHSLDISGLNGSYHIGIFVFRDTQIATVGSGKAVMRNLYLK